MTTKTTSYLLCCALTGGCVSDTDDVTDEVTDNGDIHTSTTNQALSSLTVWGWGTTGNSGPDLDLGPDTNQTCFLTGVRGSLKGYPGANGTPYSTAKVGVYQDGGHWWVKTRAGDGPGVFASGACVPFASHRTTFGVSEIGPYQSTVDDRPDRQCFLTDIYSKGHGWTAGLSQFPGESPAVLIQHQGEIWSIAGQWVPNSDGSNSGGASAVCVDIPTTEGHGFTVTADNGNHWTGVLTDSSGEKMNWNNGWVCGLRGIEGVFMDTWNDPGAEMFLNEFNKWAYDVKDDGLSGFRQLNIHCMK